jgi:hypothetical protein
MANEVITPYRPPVYEYRRTPEQRVPAPGGYRIIPGTSEGPFLVSEEQGRRPDRAGNPPAGGLPPSASPAVVNVTNANGTTPAVDTRVKIKVPNEYLLGFARGGEFLELTRNGGIVFPYTPQISYEHKADFSPLAPIHSNYPVYFYQRSSVTPISIQGKFTVQNENDASIYLSTVHLLRALTKMRSGDDPSAGSPPPVCRLFAYGLFSLDNVPVSISSVKIDLPDSVDYFSTGNNNRIFGTTAVPTLSTISVTCIPMYSRSEMQNFTVPGWLEDDALRRSGLL